MNQQIGFFILIITIILVAILFYAVVYQGNGNNNGVNAIQGPLPPPSLLEGELTITNNFDGSPNFIKTFKLINNDVNLQQYDKIIFVDENFNNTDLPLNHIDIDDIPNTTINNISFTYTNTIPVPTTADPLRIEYRIVSQFFGSSAIFSTDPFNREFNGRFNKIPPFKFDYKFIDNNIIVKLKTRFVGSVVYNTNTSIYTNMSILDLGTYDNISNYKTIKLRNFSFDDGSNTASISDYIYQNPGIITIGNYTQINIMPLNVPPVFTGENIFIRSVNDLDSQKEIIELEMII